MRVSKFHNFAKNGRFVAIAGITSLAAAIASAELSQTLLKPFLSDDTKPLVVLKSTPDLSMPAPTAAAPQSAALQSQPEQPSASWSGPVYVRRVNAMPAPTSLRLTSGASTHAPALSVTAETSSNDADLVGVVEAFAPTQAPVSSRPVTGAMYADASWLAAESDGGRWPDEAQREWSFTATDTGRPEILEADLATVVSAKTLTKSGTKSTAESSNNGSAVPHANISAGNDAPDAAEPQPTDAEQPGVAEGSDAQQTPVARPVMRTPQVNVIPPTDLDTAVAAGTPLSYEIEVDNGPGNHRFIIPPQAGLLHGVGSLDGGSVVPEPTALLGLGFIGTLTRRVRRSRA